MNLDLQDNFGVVRFEDSPFGFVRKVQQRYSFTPKQKEVLMKHFNLNGMTGQSQAYHEKIMTCAREAEVDFDIVRNWIGNVRRKKRIESSRFPSANGVFIMDNSLPSHEPKIPRMEGAHLGYPSPPQPPVPTTLVRQPTGIMHPLSSSMGPQAPQFNIPPTMTQAVMSNQPSQLATSVQRSAAPIPSTSNSSTNRQPPLQITKVESIPGQQSSCAVNAAAAAVAAAATTPPHAAQAVPSTSVGPSANDRTIFLSKERQWKEHEIRRMMGSIQQSMQYLERLGCESIVVSHFEGKTFVSGTEKGVNYFAEMQEIKPISEHMKRSAIDVSVFSPSGTDSNGSVPEDATQEQKNENNKTAGEEDQGGQAREKSNQPQSDDMEKTAQEQQEEEEDMEDEEEGDDEGDVTGNKKESSQVQAGQEVYIVDKNHFVIGIGNILPTPHQRIELKNAPPPEDYFD